MVTSPSWEWTLPILKSPFSWAKIILFLAEALILDDIVSVFVASVPPWTIRLIPPSLLVKSILSPFTLAVPATAWDIFPAAFKDTFPLCVKISPTITFPFWRTLFRYPAFTLRFIFPDPLFLAVRFTVSLIDVIFSPSTPDIPLAAFKVILSL